MLTYLERLLLLPDWDGLLFKELGGLPCLCVCCWTERRPVLERRLVVQKKGAVMRSNAPLHARKKLPAGRASFEMVRGYDDARGRFTRGRETSGRRPRNGGYQGG